MNCPQCQNASYRLDKPCPQCHFTGDILTLEQLSNLRYYQQQIHHWRHELPNNFLIKTKSIYTQKVESVEITLGLRLSPADIAAKRLLIQQIDFWLRTAQSWYQTNWLSDITLLQIQHEHTQQKQALQQELHNAAFTPFPSAADLHNAQWHFVEQQTQKLFAAGHIFTNDYAQIRHKIDTALGRPTTPPPTTQTPSQPSILDQIQINADPQSLKPPKSPPPPAKPAKPAKPQDPRPQFRWDTFWEALLSERTLRAILFLGAFLVFSGAVIWVTKNWPTFQPLTQGSILAAFTTTFFGLGHHIRVDRNLPQSGFALTAIGALLIPLDFIVFYLSQGFPPGSWPYVWFGASLLCLTIYPLLTWRHQADFFGYLSYAAFISTSLALFNLLDIPTAWWATLPALTALTAGLLHRTPALIPPTIHNLFHRPVRHLALLTLIPISLWSASGLFALSANTPPHSLAYSLNLWLMGATFACYLNQYRLPIFALAHLTLFPIAATFTHHWLYQQWSLSFGWLGPTLLTISLLYWHWPQWAPPAQDEFDGWYHHMLQRAAYATIGVGLLLASLNLIATLTTHTALALWFLLLTYTQRQPRWLIGTILFSLTASATLQLHRATHLATISLFWNLLTITYFVTAISLRHQKRRYDTILYFGAFITTFLALIPPLLFFHRPLFLYTLVHLILINGWFAYLHHTPHQYPGLASLTHYLSALRYLFPSLQTNIYHWLTALPIIGWLLVWTTFTNSYLFLTAAFALSFISLWLRRYRWVYGYPWQTTAILLAIIAWLPTTYLNIPTIPLYLGLALLTTLHATLYYQPQTFYLTGLFTALALNQYALWHNLPPAPYSFALITLSLTYFVLAYSRPRKPLTTPATHLALIFGLWSLLNHWYHLSNDILIQTMTPTNWYLLALNHLLATIPLGLTAYRHQQTPTAYITLWLFNITAALALIPFSTGSGRATLFIIIGAFAYLFLERGLYHLMIHPNKYHLLPLRQQWRFWRFPLRYTSQFLALFTIIITPLRNLVWYGGGLQRETWTIITLGLTVAYFLTHAYTYRQRRSLWIASWLVIIPWTLLAHLRWYLGGHLPTSWYGPQWLYLALILMSISWYGHCRQQHQWLKPPLTVAHFLTLLGLYWSLPLPAAGLETIPVALAIYALALLIDLDRNPKNPSNRFLHPFAFLLPFWGLTALNHFNPNPSPDAITLTLVAFSLPTLLLGRLAHHYAPYYRHPWYAVAYTTPIAAFTLALASTRPTLQFITLYLATFTLLSAWLFKKSAWLYLTTTFSALALFLLAPTPITDLFFGHPHHAYLHGWSLITLSAFYLFLSLRTRHHAPHYSQPFLISFYTILPLGLLISTYHPTGRLVAFAATTLLFTSQAITLRQPRRLWLATIPFIIATHTGLRLVIPPTYLALSHLPVILTLLLTARHLEQRFDKISPPLTRFDSWSLPFYTLTFSGLIVNVLFLARPGFNCILNLCSTPTPFHLIITLATATIIYGWALFHFRQPLWLWLTWLWLHATWFTTLLWLLFPSSVITLSLAFLPLTILTAALAPLVAQGRSRSWSLPFYTLLGLDIIFIQLLILAAWPTPTTLLITLTHTIIITIFAQYHHQRPLTYLALAGFTYLAIQLGQLLHLSPSTYLTLLATLSWLYLLTSYLLRHLAHKQLISPHATNWHQPLTHVAYGLLTLTIAGFLTYTPFILQYISLSLIHQLIPQGIHSITATNITIITALWGLIGLTIALDHRHRYLFYTSLFSLFISWNLGLLLLLGHYELQLYAVPAGLYLLFLSWLEWRTGHHNLSWWLDYAALTLLYATAFWQSFGPNGGFYALLMIIEALALVWFGSFRRLRRWLYLGIAGVVAAISSQLFEPVAQLNAGVLLGLGAFLVFIGITLEQRLDLVRHLSKEWRLKLEQWD
ncbi:MAG TPA: hypothetical protein VLL52_23700 [Anaerolineae bacterium]|nr:hypothetical protein [Anaerolineae bacterium]